MVRFDVLCPWGCSECVFKCGFIECDQVFQQCFGCNIDLVSAARTNDHGENIWRHVSGMQLDFSENVGVF